MKVLSFVSLLFLGALVVGCDSSNDDDDGDDPATYPVVGGFHALPDVGSVTLLREEEEWSSIEFGSSTELKSVGPDQYDFNFDALLPGDDTTECTGDDDGDDVKDGDECTRLASVSINAVRNHEYAIVLVGSFATREIVVYDKEVHVFDARDDDGDPKDENLEVQFFHLAQSLGNLDVYLEPPGTNLSPVQARGTLAPRGAFSDLVEDDEYVLTLTAVADPSTVFFNSEAIALDSRTHVAFAIRDGAGSGTSDVVVTQFRDRSATLFDRNVTTELRIAHVAPSIGNVDIYVNGDFSAPFVANLALTHFSTYREADQTALVNLDVDVTPAGNPGVFLARKELSLTEGERATLFLLRAANGTGLDGLKSTDHFRRLATHAQVRVLNGASRALDFYVVKTGSNIATLSPTASLGVVSSSGLQAFDPGRYDVVLKRRGTNTVVFGPRSVDLAGRGIYTIVATDTGEATAADIELLDDFTN